MIKISEELENKVEELYKTHSNRLPKREKK